MGFDFNIFNFSRMSMPSIKKPISLSLLTKTKKENREKLEQKLTSSLKNKQFNDRTILSLKVELHNMPRGKTPKYIRKYPVQVANSPSYSKIYNEPTLAAIKYAYNGFEARVFPATIENIFCPLSVPTLDSADNHILNFDVLDQTTDNKTMTTFQHYIYEQSKNNPLYKGISI